MTKRKVNCTIDAEFSTFYFPKYTYKDDEPDKFLGTPPDCYDFDKKELPAQIDLKNMKTSVLPIVPSRKIFDSFGHIGNILDVQRKLERSAVLGMIKAYVIDSSGDEHPSKLLFKAWSSVSRKTLREYISNDTRGIKRNFISSLINLRKHFVFDYAQTFSRLLSPLNKKVNLSGVRYFPVGYVTPDLNVLRQGLWSFHAFKLQDDGMFQSVEHRRVAIYYDIITNNFVIKVYGERTNVFFDDFSETSVVSNFSEGTPDYKEMEIKVKDYKIDHYRPELTRVFNTEMLSEEQVIIFSLGRFMDRYKKLVPLTISDDEVVSYKSKKLIVFPINYTLLVYSIIRTWLHVYSQYFGEEYLIQEMKPYIQCYYDELMGMYTNTYVVN